MSAVDNRTRNRILLVLFVGVLMGALDIAIVGPALPAIQKAFNADTRAMAWIFSIYVLFNLIGVPLMATLSDAFGRRNIYILAVSLFALGSLIVAASPSLPVLLAGRAIQGFGAGGIFPVASAVIGDTFPTAVRGRALGLIGAVFGIAFLIGPILGGLLLLLSWHWLFLVNLPIALVVVIAAWRLLPTTRPARRRQFDAPGMAVLAVLLAAFAFGLSQIDTAHVGDSLGSLAVWPFLLLAIVLIPLFWILERRTADPVLRVSLFGSRQVALVAGVALGAGIGEAAIAFVPKLLTAAFGVSESEASFMLLPVVLCMAIGSPVAGRVLDRAGSRIVVVAGLALLAAGMVLVGLMQPQLVAFYLAAALVGLGLSSLLGAPLRYIILNETPAAERAAAQGLLTLLTSVGQLVGGTGTGAVAASQGGGVGGYQAAFLSIGLLAAVLTLAALALKGRAAELATARGHEQTAPAGTAPRPAA